MLLNGVIGMIGLNCFLWYSFIFLDIGYMMVG